MNNWHASSITDVLAQLDTCQTGLALTEAADRLAHSGRNEITRRKPVSPIRLFLKQSANYFTLVLLFAALLLAYIVSFLPGEGGRRLTAAAST